MAGLAGRNFLRMGLHDHLATKHASPIARGQPFVELHASGVRRLVIDARLMVDMLAGTH